MLGIIICLGGVLLTVVHDKTIDKLFDSGNFVMWGDEYVVNLRAKISAQEIRYLENVTLLANDARESDKEDGT